MITVNARAMTRGRAVVALAMVAVTGIACASTSATTPAGQEPARPPAPEMKRGLQIDLRIFSLRFHMRLASLDHESV